MEPLSQLDPATYTRLLYLWGALGILSSASIHLSRQLPLSSRNEGQGLARFGTVDKKLGWIVMETPILLAVSWVGLYLARRMYHTRPLPRSNHRGVRA